MAQLPCGVESNHENENEYSRYYWVGIEPLGWIAWLRPAVCNKISSPSQNCGSKVKAASIMMSAAAPIFTLPLCTPARINTKTFCYFRGIQIQLRIIESFQSRTLINQPTPLYYTNLILIHLMWFTSDLIKINFRFS